MFAKRNKGQMFLIAAVVVALAILSFKGFFSVYGTSEEGRHESMKLYDRQIANVVKEYESTLAVGSLQSSLNSSTVSYLNSYSSYIYNDSVRALYLFAYQNSSTRNFSVSIGNYLGDRVNGSLTFSDPASSDSFDLSDKQTYSSSWLDPAASSGTVTLTLSYSFKGTERQESVPITIGAQNFTKGFFDVTISDDYLTVRRKSVYNRSW